MDKKIVFITGISTGFGYETAKKLSQTYTVYGGVRNLECHNKIPGVTYLKCDVTSTEDIQNACRTIEEKEGALHYLINNAGCALGGFFEDISEEEFRKHIDVNFFGVLAVTRAALPLLRKTNGNKKIVMLSSIAGLTGTPSVGAYNAGKWALEGFSESLFFELKPFNIDVVLIEPGTFKTDIFSRNLSFGNKMNDMNSPYYSYSQHIKALFDKRMEKVTRHPKDVASLIEYVLKKHNPRLRYLIGIDAQVRYRVKQLIPFSWYAALIRKVVKL